MCEQSFVFIKSEPAPKSLEIVEFQIVYPEP